MPFNFTQTPFEKHTELVLSGLMFETYSIYLDDVKVYGNIRRGSGTASAPTG